MFTPHIAHLLPRTRIGKTSLALAIGGALGFASMSACAQQMSASQFVSACERNPGNTVYLSQPLKLQGGFTGETHVAASGCTVQLAPDASFELDTITLRFGGTFAVLGGTKGRVVAEKAVLVAPAIRLQLTGSESELMMKEARLFASGGDFDIAFGSKGKLEMTNSGGWTRGGLAADGALRISAGGFFGGVMSDSGAEAADGIFLAMNGQDSSWKIEKSTLNVSNFTFADASAFRSGPLSIASGAFKANVEISETNLRFAGKAIDMRLVGAESSLILNKVSSQTGSQAVYLGTPGQKGVVLIENSLFFGNPGIDVVSGASGATAVIGNPGSLYGQQRVSVRTGAGGACVVTPLSSLIAPQVSACR